MLRHVTKQVGTVNSLLIPYQSRDAVCVRMSASRQKRPFPQGRFLYDRDMPSFPNKEAALAGRISLAKSEATGCARADRELTISPALTDLAHTTPQIHADLVSPPEERRDWLSRA